MGLRSAIVEQTAERRRVARLAICRSSGHRFATAFRFRRDRLTERLSEFLSVDFIHKLYTTVRATPNTESIGESASRLLSSKVSQHQLVLRDYAGRLMHLRARPLVNDDLSIYLPMYLSGVDVTIAAATFRSPPPLPSGSRPLLFTRAAERREG